MIFIDNKYLQIYNNIIDRARSRGKIDVYTEKHHILPRSLGGTSDLSNLVHLTGREHFIAHRLLVKITNGDAQNKMIFALNSMMNRYNKTMSRYTPTSTVYEYLRIKLSEAHKRMGRTEEHKAAISKAHTGKIVSADTRRRQSEAVKAAGPAGGAVKGSVRKESTRDAISNARKGITFSEEHKLKLSEAKKGRTPWNKGKTYKQKKAGS
jgi:hypothetical protein